MTFVSLNTIIFLKVHKEIVFYTYEANYSAPKFAILQEGVERIL